MKKKWITKAETAKILAAYSIRKDEFEPVGYNGYVYQSRIVKGYAISVSPEKHKTPDYYHETGRIIVSHTQSDGRKTYNDIWERDPDGCLQFSFRNLWNQPFSDADYIRELEEQLKKLQLSGKELNENSDFQPGDIENIFDSEKYQELINEISSLRAENETLKSGMKHNARGAGRKPSKERLRTIEKANKLIASGAGEQEIMDMLGISRATFYRYKKSIKN